MRQPNFRQACVQSLCQGLVERNFDPTKWTVIVEQTRELLGPWLCPQAPDSTNAIQTPSRKLMMHDRLYARARDCQLILQVGAPNLFPAQSPVRRLSYDLLESTVPQPNQNRQQKSAAALSRTRAQPRSMNLRAIRRGEGRKRRTSGINPSLASHSVNLDSCSHHDITSLQHCCRFHSMLFL